jgi:hypothetical protein
MTRAASREGPPGHHRLAQRGDHVLVERLAGAPGSLVRSSTAIALTVFGRPDEEGSASNGRNSRTLTTPTFSPCGDQLLDRLVAAPAPEPISTITRSASGRADVVEQVVAPAGQLSRTCPSPSARCPGHGVVEGVAGLAGLEEDVRVLRRAAQHRRGRAFSARARWARTRSSSIMPA